MVKITPEQARKRFKTLPEEIKEVIFSEQTAEIIGKIGEESHLPQDKTSKMAEIAGLVLLGFLHAEDVAAELEEVLVINSLMARSLQDSLQKKLFYRYKDALDKIYSPKPDEIAEPQKISFDSITPAKPAAPQAPVLGVIAPKPLETISAVPTAPPKTPTPAPFKSTPSPAATPTAKVNPFASFGGALTPAQTSPKTPEPAKPTPAPLVIHTENKDPQMVRAPRFKLESSGAPLSAFGFAGKAATTPQIPKPAQIEIGREEKLKPVEKISKFESSPKAIHYSSLSSPITTEGASKGGFSQQQASFGNITPMPSSSADKPALPTNESASRLIAPITPAVPKPASPTTIQTKNPLVRPPITPPSFGGLVKNMVSPEKKDFSGPATPPPAPVK